MADEVQKKKSANDFPETVKCLFEGMDGFVSTKTIVGEPITVDDITIIPLADASFGMGAGAFNNDKTKSGAGGMTGKVTPTAVLVIQKSGVRVVNVKNQDTVVKILDMLPDLIPEVVEKVKELIRGKDKKDEANEEKVQEAVDQVLDELKEEEF